jgi:hypothetical protein
MYDDSLIIERLFQPYAIMPSQYFDPRPGELSPEKRLMFAVLTDALRCYASRGKTAANEAEWWLFRTKGDQLFSFHNVCDALEIDPDHLRRGLLRWRDRRLAGEDPRMVRRAPVGLSAHLGGPAPHLRRAHRRGAPPNASPPPTASGQRGGSTADQERWNSSSLGRGRSTGC